MKKILTLAAFLLAAVPQLMAQVSFTVKGTAKPDATMLMMGDMANPRAQAETIEVKEGQFTVAGSKPDGTVMFIIDQQNRLQSFFIVDGSTVTLDMNTDIATGSHQNEELSKLMQQMNATKDDDAQEAALRQALSANKDNAVAAFALSMLMYSMGYDELKQTLESGDAYLSHPLCDQAKQQLKALEKRAPGTMFKDIAEADTLGVNHKLSEYVGRGQYVLVDFWASWCGPCMQEMPNVKANYEKYREKGFQVVGLSFDRNADAWKKAIREKGLNWVHLSDLKFWQTVAAETYGIRSIPSSILCDPQGKIIAVDLRGPKLGEKLKEIYGF